VLLFHREPTFIQSTSRAPPRSVKDRINAVMDGSSRTGSTWSWSVSGRPGVDPLRPSHLRMTAGGSFRTAAFSAMPRETILVLRKSSQRQSVSGHRTHRYTFSVEFALVHAANKPGGGIRVQAMPEA